MIEFVFKVLVRYYEMMLSVGKFEGKDVRNRILEETLWHCDVKKDKEKREESGKGKERAVSSWAVVSRRRDKLYIACTSNRP